MSDVSSIKQHELNNQFLSLFASLLGKKESWSNFFRWKFLEQIKPEILSSQLILKFLNIYHNLQKRWKMFTLTVMNYSCGKKIK